VLLVTFIKKSRDALKSISKTSLSRNKQQKYKTPPNLSSILDPETERITNDPALINKINQNPVPGQTYQPTRALSLAHHDPRRTISKPPYDIR
jgi:hypothetical protein